MPSSGDVVDEGDVVSFQATIGDGGHTHRSQVSWTSNLDGEFSKKAATAAARFFYHSDSVSALHHGKGQRHRRTLRRVCLFQVNGIPSAPEVELTPDPATTSDDLVVTIIPPPQTPTGIRQLQLCLVG